METESILEEAERLVNGDRQAAYGDPTVNFKSIALLWNAYLQSRTLSGRSQDIEPHDVAKMMMLMKISRDINSPKRDNSTDIAGYSHCNHLCNQLRHQD